MKKELQKIYKHEIYKYKKYDYNGVFWANYCFVDSNFGRVFNLNPLLLVLGSEVKYLFSSEELRRKLNILYSLNFQPNLNFCHSNYFETGLIKLFDQ